MLFYIDPGTGSMLFTILIGVLGAAVYALREVFMKLRFRLNGGKTEALSGSETPVVIFTDSKRYWNVFEPICSEFERRKEKLEYLTSSPDDPALDQKYEYVHCQFIGEGNKAFARLNTLHSDIVLSSTPSLDVLYWKRSRDVKWYVHIPHAASDITIYRMFGIDYYDTILISGDYQENQIRKLEQLRNLPPKEIVKVGITYMDEMKKRLDAADLLPEHPRTVLLAPSWGPSAILSVYGSSVIKALLETGYHVIVRPHPQSYTAEKELLEKIMSEYPASEQLEWNRDNDNFDVLRRADVMISDFSGVIFDFTLVFDKPVIYADTSFNKDPYDAAWLDEELWTFSVLPKIGRQLTRDDLTDMKDLIDSCLSDESFKQGRDEARKETWAYIGESTSRVVDYLLQKRMDLIQDKSKARDERNKES